MSAWCFTIVKVVEHVTNYISKVYTMALIAMNLFSLAFALVGYTSSSEEYISFGLFVFISAPLFIIVGSIALYGLLAGKYRGKCKILQNISNVV